MTAHSRRKQGKLRARHNANMRRVIKEFCGKLDKMIGMAAKELLQQLAFPLGFADAINQTMSDSIQNLIEAENGEKAVIARNINTLK